MNTLIDILAGKRDQKQKGITFIEGNDREQFLSYAALYDAALGGLSFLQKKGVCAGDELVIQIDDNRTFIILFWSCILGGIVPVPLAIGQNDDHKQKLFTVWPVLSNPHLIISRENFEKTRMLAASINRVDELALIEEHVIDVADLGDVQEAGEIYGVTATDVAFIQFSSGSTGSPKGVVLTHHNLICNMEAISKGAEYSVADSTLSWMPLTHDMGLIGFHINPLLVGMNQYLIPTSLFVRTPGMWLDKASAHKATVLCSPNFGYRYFIKHGYPPKADIWDLSSVRIIYNGAEPISVKLCEEFLTALSRYGLKSTAMCPVYGLAEASLAVSMSRLGDPVIDVKLDRYRLNLGDAVSIPPEASRAISFVNVGRPIDHCAVIVANDSNLSVPEGVIGHVLIRGENVTRGYYHNPDETEKIMAGNGWVKTGDLGFLRDGALYITGRYKDVIFVNGQNYYPHDIERVAEEVAGIELNKVVVTGCFQESRERDEVTAFVFHRGSLDKFVPIVKLLKAHVNSKTGLTIDNVIPVKDIPRTTSGKLRRFKMQEQYQQGYFADTVRALAEMMTDPGAVSDSSSQTVTQRIMQIWKNVLKTGAMSETTRFFEAGGSSLKAAEAGMMIFREFGVEVPLQTLYERQTAGELADAVTALSAREYIPVASAPICTYYDVSSSQRRLYYLWASDRTSTAYNIPVALQITGKLDVRKIEAGMRQLILRHDVLRTTFHMTTEPKCEVHSQMAFSLDTVECTPEVCDTVLKSFVQPFDLEKGPLFRVHVLHTALDAYFLFLDFHHIISDGISVYNLLHELLDLYHGRLLSPVRHQYKDYVLWEREHFNAVQIKSQPYWTHQLQGELPVLELPYDMARPGIFHGEGAKLAYTISRATAERLRRLADAHACTLHVLLFSLYNVLLSKYTGQDDIIIGIPVGTRRHPDLIPMQGMFVNNLPIRAVVPGQASFSQFLQDVKTTVAHALLHQDYSFEDLLQAVGAKRDVSRNALFDTMFVYQNMGFPQTTDAEFTLGRYFFDPGISKFDLSMEVFEEGVSLSYNIEYSTRLLTQDTIVRLAAHFDKLIQEVLRDSNQAISSLQIISEEEYHICVDQFNATQHTGARGDTIYELFERQVRSTPMHVALEYNDEQITYEALSQSVDRLVYTLQRSGVQTGATVAVLLQRSPELITGILAILKSGGCYLPIDPVLPHDRIKYILEDSHCSIVITDTRNVPGAARLLNEIPAGRMSIMDLSADAPYGFRADHTGCNTVSGEDLAYIIYTSGTTGNPKGVMIEHRSLVNYICWAAGQYVQQEASVFPLYTSVSFDLTVTSIFTPLITGGKIVIYADDPGEMLINRVVSENKATIVKLTPAHLRVLAAGRWPALRSGSRIRTFIVGGEQLESRLAREIHDLFNGRIEIYNEYGPTEATVGCMIHKFNPDELYDAVPIGIPIDNTQIYLLDKFLSPVPLGVTGELYIGGIGVARGYCFEVGLTEKKFITNPFIRGGRLYKTGDLARWLPCGRIQYIGRNDQQVKINGYRVELSEIERHLNDHAGITETVVTVQLNKKGDKMLCAYYKSENPIAASVLRSYLAGRLPHYMIPHHFTCLDTIPLTRNGKVDYDALRVSEVRTGEEGNGLARNKIEALSLEIWASVLGEENMSITDNFFELGGDSIKAVQISSRLLEKQVVLQVKDILTYHTIAQTCLHARAVAHEDKYEQGILVGAINPLPIQAWFFDQHFFNPNFYNQSVLFKLGKLFDIDVMAAAFTQLVRHHDGLRLNYDAKNKRLYYNNDHLDRDFVIGRHALPNGTSLGSVCSDIKAGFDLKDGLLLRAAILTQADASELLLITAHHLLMDGISWRIFLEDLVTSYQALEGGTVPAFPRKTASLSDWSNGMAAYFSSRSNAAEMNYWDKIDAIPFIIPQDHDIDDWRTASLEKVSCVALDSQRTQYLLREAHRAYHTDAWVLLNTALALTLKEWTGADKFVIEHENHGRHLDNVDATATLGWFTAMYPVCLELTAGNLGDQIKAIKEQLRHVPDHGMGYGVYRYTNQPAHKAKGLREIRFNYLGQFGQEFNNDLWVYDRRPHGHETDVNNKMTAKLELNAMVMGGQMLLDISYNAAAHDGSTITWFRDQFLSSLACLLEYLEEDGDLHFTPSDFGIANLDQKELDTLFQ